MSTLLIELRGAQQAWGSRSRFVTRATELAPTRSGVVGLLAAALGMDRTEPLERFDGLRFGVRIDQPGRLDRDFQTAVARDGTPQPLSHRYYLADAVFLVGIEASDEDLAEYRTALTHPYYPPFLGRRAFPPAGPINTWLSQERLEAALAGHPWLARPQHARRVKESALSLEVITDAVAGAVGDETWHDVPESFDPRRRRYGSRDIVRRHVVVPHPNPPSTASITHDARPGDVQRHGDTLLGEPSEHDAMSLLADEEI